MLLDCFHDLVAPASAQHAGAGGADLHKVLSGGTAVVHGIERGHFVDAHGRHLEDAGDFVHDTDAGEAVLALAEVEQGHHRGFLVLGWVAFEDLIDEAQVLWAEFEWNRGIVVFCVAMLGVALAEYV